MKVWNLLLSVEKRETARIQIEVQMKTHELPSLPYDYAALEPFISRETLHFHHDKHHRAYVDQLNKLIPGSGFEGVALSEIVMEATGSLFEQAAQGWNHAFLWKSMSPGNNGIPKSGKLISALTSAFGSEEKFKARFEATGGALFGSGWLWLVADTQGTLQLLATKDAGNPMTDALTPILVCDLWEHAYYIDYRNARAKYLSAFYGIIDWDFAEACYSDAKRSRFQARRPKPAESVLH